MANTTILSWNVRGLNMQARRDTVRTLGDDLRPSVVCLQETKLNVITQYTVFSLLGREFVDFAYLPASETRSEILIAGRRNMVVLSDVHIGCFSVIVAVLAEGSVAGDSKWWLTAVYGPQDDANKVLFMEELKAVRDACPGPWAVTGDFNLILNEEDKNNGRIDRANLRRFRRTVAPLGMHDMHLHGRCYTWSNERVS